LFNSISKDPETVVALVGPGRSN